VVTYALLGVVIWPSAEDAKRTIGATVFDVEQQLAGEVDISLHDGTPLHV
jgi:hypothetical protein